MQSENLEKLLKILGIIMLISFGLKVLGFLISFVFGITTFLLLPFFVLAMVFGIPMLAIYGLYKLLFGRNKTWYN